jgi:hypothetical protein
VPVLCQADDRDTSIDVCRLARDELVARHTLQQVGHRGKLDRCQFGKLRYVLRPSCRETNQDAPLLDGNAVSLRFRFEVGADAARDAVDVRKKSSNTKVSLSALSLRRLKRFP